MNKIASPVDFLELNPTYLQPVVESIPKSFEMRENRRIDALAATREIIRRASLREFDVTSVKEASDISGEPGIYVFGENDISSLSEVEFSPSEELLSGAADSAHAVILGDLVVRSSRNDDNPVETQAAAKCSLKRDYSDRVRRALTEIKLSQELDKWGFMAFKPILLAIGEDGGPSNGAIVLMTEYDSSITSLDNMPWGRGPEKLDLKAYAVGAATSLAEFHTDFSCAHGDAKIKNFVTGSSGKINPIDFETSTPFDNTNPLEVGTVIIQDFALLLSSLEHRGFLNRTGYNAPRNAIEAMTEAYINGWADKGFSNEVQEAVLHMALYVAKPYNSHYE